MERKPQPKMVECTCANKSCGARFMARVADRKRGWGKFCSKSCKAQKQERRTGQYRDFKERERCRDEHGFTPVIFSRDGSMYGADGQGVNRNGDPEFIGAGNFSNEEHDCNKD